MSADDIATVLEAIGDSWPAALVVIAGVIGFVAWKALPYLKDIRDKTADVHHEMYPNSGKSLRDQMNRIEAWTIQHQAESEEDRERLDAIEGALTAPDSPDAPQ
ncbi:hypothetical protein [Promicromonospora sp. NPDC023987]|uniref:hypothetical protein n=1 Tax=Promicromonospora sp. NPDC023987 TaxID=3155360 RepID=UPI0033F0A7FF